MSCYIAVHGGAGFHSTQNEKELRKILRRACAKALKLLQTGGDASEAVENAIMVLEDFDGLNAGHGANLTQKRTVECDAAIMEESGKFGSVGAVSGVKNPICLAKAILDHSRKPDSLGRVPPLTLVSNGAHDFASISNIATVHPDTMISSRAQKEWKMWSDKAKCDITNEMSYQGNDGDKLMQDTVGCLALDASGHLAAGVSSGGLLLKLPGRVGEAAVFGAGCWAHCLNTEEGVASSVSGTGEAIIRASLARALCDVLCTDDPHEGLVRMLDIDFAQVYSTPGNQTPSAGAILLSKAIREDKSTVSRLWCVFNTASMAIAYASSEDPKPRSMILRQSNSEAVFLGGEKPVYITMLPWTTE